MLFAFGGAYFVNRGEAPKDVHVLHTCLCHICDLEAVLQAQPGFYNGSAILEIKLVEALRVPRVVQLLALWCCDAVGLCSCCADDDVQP